MNTLKKILDTLIGVETAVIPILHVSPGVNKILAITLIAAEDLEAILAGLGAQVPSTKA